MKGTSESYLRTCASAAVPLKPGRVKSLKMISHPPLKRAAASVAALWACSNLTEYPALVSSLTISKVSSSESSMTRTFKVVAIHQHQKPLARTPIFLDVATGPRTNPGFCNSDRFA